MKITKDKVVQIDYILKDDEGRQLDSSKEGEPLEYLHGNNNLIPGLERELEGKEPGDSVTAVVAPKDAYGEYNDKLIVDVPRAQFDSDLSIDAGMQFQADTASGPMIVRVIKIAGDTITVDGNHELAGKTLHFNIKIVNVRDATPEELKPSEDGCGGECGSCGGSCHGEEGNCENDCGGGCCGH